MINICFDSSSLSYIVKNAENAKQKAISRMDIFPQSEEKEILLYIIESIKKTMEFPLMESTISNSEVKSSFGN